MLPASPRPCINPCSAARTQANSPASTSTSTTFTQLRSSTATMFDTCTVKPLDACVPLAVSPISETTDRSPHAHLTTGDPGASQKDSAFRFKGQVVTFPDGTRWQLLEPLSNIKLQQVNAPCEGTQVFTCKCLDESRWSNGEAVMKVKFQYVLRNQIQ